MSLEILLMLLAWLAFGVWGTVKAVHWHDRELPDEPIPLLQGLALVLITVLGPINILYYEIVLGSTATKEQHDG